MSLKDLQLPSIASLRAIAALRSPNLALVRPARIGLGFESSGSNQKTLLEVEELLGGPGRLSLPYSLRWLLDVLTGLGVLHRTLGFVHGEVQPEHIVLGEDGVGRLMPVVRAHWVRGEARAPERLYYLAPEKLLGDKVDVRADVFSVGVMLWEALAGQRLLEATEVDDIIARMMGGGVPRAEPPEAEAWTLPLADIAERAIAVDPARRFASVAEMRQALENACQRYLASAPGMAELFENPERRARSRLRDSLPPDSQRVTLPPNKALPLEEPRTESQRLDAAAERLSRSSWTALDEDDDTTIKPNAKPVPAEPVPVSKSVPVGSPEPARKTTPRKGAHVNTLLGVPPPFIERRTPIGADQLKAVSGSVVPSSSAPTVLTSLSSMNVTVPVGTPAPVIAPRPSPPPPFEEPPRSEAGRLASLSPLIAAHDGAPPAAEPSFELLKPRKKRGALWLVLGAAAAMGLFAARPWLARQVAAATGTMPFTTPPAEPAQRAAASPTPTATAASETATAPPSASVAPAVGIASTPAEPEPAPRAVRGGRAQPHVVIDDRLQLEPPATPAPPSPPVEKKPEPAAEPPPAPAPPPPPPPAPKPKAPPVSDADRYGI